MSPGRDGMTTKIGQIRRALAPPDRSQPGPTMPSGEPDPGRLHAMEARIAHLEQLVQGLQDSVYREAQRHDKWLSELEAQLDPQALAAALSKNARERGI
jgi:hypothetical protein